MVIAAFTVAAFPIRVLGCCKDSRTESRSVFLEKSISLASLVDQRLKYLPPMQETRVRSLGREDPLEKWKIPWTEKPGRLQSMVSQRVGQD